jgi:uncharacterized protein (TIGR00299 family) protein
LPENTVLIDVTTAGASGDMFLSALLDLLGEDQALVPVAASLLIYDPSLRVRVVSHVSGTGSGKRLEITYDRGVRLAPGSMLDIMGAVAEELELSQIARTVARKALDVILDAEVRAHETTIDELHLHETGSIDTILDIVGTMYLLEKAKLLGRARFIGTRVAVGSGTVKTEHGETEVPVPAVAEILVAHDVPFHTGAAKTEVLTPTGAALLVALVNEYVDSAEGFLSKRQGIGFGNRDLGPVSNMMRIIVGEPESEQETPPETKPSKSKEAKETKASKEAKAAVVREPRELGEPTELHESWSEDEVIVIETNVDDVDGEVMGGLFDTLLSEGLAYDVVMMPAFGKKNRPCFIVKVIAPKTGLKNIAAIMIRHLGTLGIRYSSWQRMKASRETIVCQLQIDEHEYMVRVKISRAPDGSIINVKPEADDVIKISAETGIPIRELKPRIALQAHAITD